MDKKQIALEYLQEQKDEFLKKLDAINMSIELLKTTDSAPLSIRHKNNLNNIIIEKEKEDDYDVNGSLIAKFLYFLNKHQRFLHFREVAEMIIEKEGLDVGSTELGQKLSNSATPIKNKTIKKVTVGKSLVNTFWGSAKWINEDGTIKKGYEYNADFLNKSSADNYKGLF